MTHPTKQKSQAQPSRATFDVFPLILSVIWVVLAILVDPRGDFPLNDDWSYGKAVENLVVEGRLAFTDWSEMTLLTQLLWGALFCRIGGFSFTALRLSTLVLSLVGVLATYGAIRRVGAKPRVALLGALTLALNPIYFCLSYTFMTDVPFIAIAMVSVYFFVRYLEDARTPDYALGVLAMIAALYVRQFALLIPLGFAVALVAQRGFGKRPLCLAAAPLALALLALWLHKTILTHLGALPALYAGGPEQVARGLATGSLSGYVLAIGGIGAFIGLSALPLGLHVTATTAARLTRQRAVAAAAVVVALVTAIGLSCAATGTNLIHLGNILYDTGLGPPTVRDMRVDALNLDLLPHGPPWLWYAITAVAIVAFVPLVQWTLGLAACSVGPLRRRSSDVPAAAIFVFMAAAAYVTAILAINRLFDRYIIVLLPLVLVLGGWYAARRHVAHRPPALVAGFILVAALGIFSVAGTHDYLAWNRARWAAIHDLFAQGVTPDRIDGGFEFSGRYLYEDRLEHPAKSRWWVRDDEYIIAFGPMPGYKTHQTYEYPSWLAPGHGRILALRRR